MLCAGGCGRMAFCISQVRQEADGLFVSVIWGGPIQTGGQGVGKHLDITTTQGLKGSRKEVMTGIQRRKEYWDRTDWQELWPSLEGCSKNNSSHIYPITLWQIDRGKVETVTDFIFWGSKVTADSDCSHEIKRRLLLERKAMTDLDNVLKSRDITLPTE